MIIFAFDSHGAFGHLIEACQKYKPAALILLGDNELPRSIPVLFKSVIDDGVEVYAIEGNHDKETGPRSKNYPHMLDGRIKEIDGLKIGGLALDKVRHAEMCEEEIDIVVSHYPPAGFFPSSPFGKQVAELTLKSNAVAVFHGHIHPTIGAGARIYEFSHALSVSTCGHIFDEHGNNLGGWDYPDGKNSRLMPPQKPTPFDIEDFDKFIFRYKSGDVNEVIVMQSKFSRCVQCIGHSSSCDHYGWCARNAKIDENWNIDISNGKLNASAAINFLAAKQRSYKTMLTELVNERRKVNFYGE